MPHTSSVCTDASYPAIAQDGDATLTETIAATAEICGHRLSERATHMLARDLADLPEAAVVDALARCRLELRGRLSIGEILTRIEDGRPSSAEAWAMMPKSEAASVVWTDEMAKAWGSVLPLLQNGEWQEARGVFEKVYAQCVLLARCKREKIRWHPSLGSDLAQRESVLIEAVRKERLSASYVQELLPYRSLSPEALQLLSQLQIKNVS